MSAARLGMGVIAVAWAGGTAQAETPAPACVVHGDRVTLEEVTVTPAGGASFVLDVRDVAVTAHLPARRGAPTTLDVEGALVFRATRTHVWFRVAQDVVSESGMVTLRRGASLVDVHLEGDRVVGSAVLYAYDVITGEKKAPTLAATGVVVPCAALRLGAGVFDADHAVAVEEVELADAGDDGDADDAAEPEVWWQLRHDAGRLTLRTAPRAGAPAVTLESPTCTGCIEVRQLASRGGWLLVEQASEAVSARGWVERARMRRLPEDEGGGGQSYGCSGRHRGGGAWGEGWAGGKPPAGLYDGPAVVQAGAPVFDGDHEWGRVAADTPVVVRHHLGQSWVALRKIPGLAGDPPGSPWLNASVRAIDVIFPADVQARRTPAP